MSSRDSCPKLLKCEAPLCPLEDVYTNATYVWFPGDPICPSRHQATSKIVSVQKRIVKIGGDPDCYWTVPMLLEVKRVKKGIKGVTERQEEIMANALHTVIRPAPIVSTKKCSVRRGKRTKKK